MAFAGKMQHIKDRVLEYMNASFIIYPSVELVLLKLCMWSEFYMYNFASDALSVG